jgi:DNA-binding XRE family transcriptional regulator
VNRSTVYWDRRGTDVEDQIPNKLSEILDLRKRMGVFPNSINQLAAVADVSRNTVWNLAKGVYWPKLDTAYKLARALNTTVYDIWSEAMILKFIKDLRHVDMLRTMRELRDEVEEN